MLSLRGRAGEGRGVGGGWVGGMEGRGVGGRHILGDGRGVGGKYG